MSLYIIKVERFDLIWQGKVLLKLTSHKVNHFKANSSVAASTLARLCDHHLYLVTKHITKAFPNSPPLPSGITHLLSASVDLPFSACFI